MDRWVIVAAACLLASCGLSFVGPGARALPASYQRVAVPVFENRSAEPQLGVDCARGLQDRLSAGGRRVVSEPQGADLVLIGVIEEVEDRPVAFEDLGQRARRVETELVVVLTLTARSQGEEIWRVDREPGQRVFTASGTPFEVHAARKAAAQAACEEVALLLADELVDMLWEDPGASGMARGSLSDDEAPEDLGPARPTEPSGPVGLPPKKKKKNVDISDPKR